MREKLNSISAAILDAAIAVHRELGPGLLENAYEACLEFERSTVDTESSDRKNCRLFIAE